MDPIEAKLDGPIGGLLLVVLGVLTLHGSSLHWFGLAQVRIVTLLGAFGADHGVGLALLLPGGFAPVTVTLGGAAEHAWSPWRWW